MFEYFISLFLTLISMALGVILGWYYRDKRAEHDAKAHAEATADAILYSMNGFSDAELRQFYQTSSDNHLKLLKKENN